MSTPAGYLSVTARAEAACASKAETVTPEDRCHCPARDYAEATNALVRARRARVTRDVLLWAAYCALLGVLCVAAL